MSSIIRFEHEQEPETQLYRRNLFHCFVAKTRFWISSVSQLEFSRRLIRSLALPERCTTIVVTAIPDSRTNRAQQDLAPLELDTYLSVLSRANKIAMKSQVFVDIMIISTQINMQTSKALTIDMYKTLAEIVMQPLHSPVIVATIQAI